MTWDENNPQRNSVLHVRCSTSRGKELKYDPTAWFCLFYPDGNNKTGGQDLTDKQLLQVAERLGQEWEQVAIYLDLSITDLDNIKAEKQSTVAMQKMRMLELWKRRRPGKATAKNLLSSLEDLKDLPVEAHQLLTGNVLHTHTHTHTHTPPPPTEGNAMPP